MSTIQTLSLWQLALGFLPVIVVLIIQIRWSLDVKTTVYALVRMLAQLLLIGYVLMYIFAAQQSYLILFVLMVMMLTASWIAMRTIPQCRREHYLSAVISIATGGGLTLLVITQMVLNIEPWYEPHAMIPLAGMIFANSMNAVSITAERYFAERTRGVEYHPARCQAFQASLIPILNGLFAVGLVSLPGMMTGQILSGVEPAIAARYQILVMMMLLGASGISSAVFWLGCDRLLSLRTVIK